MRSCLLPLLLAVSTAAAQGPPGAAAAKVVRAHQLVDGETLTLDGRLDDAVWQRIAPISDFRTLEPVEGGAPSERTDVRIAYDADHLYIGVMLYDSDPDGIKAFQKRWDQSLATDDRFMWILDTFGDQRNAYFFEINPAGLMGDGLLRTGQGSALTKAWNGIWRAWVQQGSEGWSAEIRIPFRTLNFDPASSEWGINFQRTIRRKNEEQVWSGARRAEGLLRPQNAGVLTGLTGHTQGLGLEVQPYTLAAQRVVGAAGSRAVHETRLGADINYSITPNLRAGFTVNTDFAETDVDDRQVNLTRFPLFFPERRAFFLEGSSVFAFATSSSPNPFFSRRVGLEDGSPVPVLGGARLIGRAGQQDIGALHLRTRGGAGRAAEDFSVLRVSRNVWRESRVGMIYTRRAAVGDSLPDAHTVGVDVELSTSRFWGSRNLQFQGFAVAHTDQEPAGAGGSLADRSARGFRINFPNRPWDAHVSLREFGTAYDPAMGFAPRVGFRRVQPSVSWRPLLPQVAAVRELTFEYFHEYLADDRWRPLTVNHRITPVGVRFESGDALSVQWLWNYEYLDQPFDILRNGRYVIATGEYTNTGVRVEAQTAAFRRVVAAVSAQRAGFWTGTRDDLSVDLVARPFRGTNLTASWIYNRAVLPEGRFDATILRALATVDVTPLLAFTFNTQYDNVSRLLGTQHRMTWMLSPGNTVFLVYQHNWRSPLDERVVTVERQATMKVAFTQRF